MKYSVYLSAYAQHTTMVHLMGAGQHDSINLSARKDMNTQQRKKKLKIISLFLTTIVLLTISCGDKKSNNTQIIHR